MAECPVCILDSQRHWAKPSFCRPLACLECHATSEITGFQRTLWPFELIAPLLHPDYHCSVHLLLVNNLLKIHRIINIHNLFSNLTLTYLEVKTYPNLTWAYSQSLFILFSVTMHSSPYRNINVFDYGVPPIIGNATTIIHIMCIMFPKFKKNLNFKIHLVPRFHVGKCGPINIC